MKVYKKIINLLLIVLLFSSFATGLIAKGDIMVSLRFYKGLRNGDTQETGVVTTYHLKPLFVGNMISASNLRQEKDELKRIFNLEGLKLVTQTRWAWQEKHKDKRFQVIILNGHEFLVKLELTKKSDGFNASVIEKQKQGNKILLDTEISLPQKKTAVFGFEDSMKKTYFLSFYREKDEVVIREEPVPLMEENKPRLIKGDKPVYPKRVQEAKIEGKVMMEVTTDESGRVLNIRVFRGHPLLRVPAMRAVKEWQYEPYIVKGQAKPAIFTISVDFSLKDSQKKSNPSMMIWPTKGYLSSKFGLRVHPITGKRNFHQGIDIATKEGKKVVAAADGTVIFAEFKKVWGNLLIIQHRDGYTTRYGQLKSFAVKKGDKVKQGDLIAYVGSSGLSTAPHLHWEVRLDKKPINPVMMMDE
jgi:TonB family protein